MVMVIHDPSPIFWVLFALLRAVWSDPFHQNLIFKEPKYGAYTELCTSLWPEITSKRDGAFIIP